MKYLFGPVVSRRLGVSLGVDIIPYKLCSLDCVYCECGSTTHLTRETGEYAPFDEVIAEIDAFLAGNPVLDYVTFSGSGEPALNRRIGDIIRYIKNGYPVYKVAVLTNSTLMNSSDSRRDLMDADMVLPSLDAISPEIFNRIARPVSGIDPRDIVEGLVLFRKEFRGRICLEIFIVQGLNDTPGELEKLKNACMRIKPDEVHLNSLDRRAVEEWVMKASGSRLEEIKEFFMPLPVKVVARQGDGGDAGSARNHSIDEMMLDILKKASPSVEEIASALDLRVVDILKASERLETAGRIKITGKSNRELSPGLRILTLT